MTEMEPEGPSLVIRAALAAGADRARDEAGKLGMPFPEDRTGEFAEHVIEAVKDVDISPFDSELHPPQLLAWIVEQVMARALVSEGIRLGIKMDALSSAAVASLIREILRGIIEWFRD